MLPFNVVTAACRTKSKPLHKTSRYGGETTTKKKEGVQREKKKKENSNGGTTAPAIPADSFQSQRFVHISHTF